MSDFLNRTDSLGMFDSDSSFSSSSSSSSQSSSFGYSPPDLSDITAGDESIESLSFAGQRDLLQQPREVITRVENESVVSQAEELVSVIHRIVQWVQQEKPDMAPLPLLSANLEDDGSVVFMWAFPAFRVGFNLELESENSGWHFVSTKESGGVAVSGALTEMDEAMSLLITLLKAYI